jgi:ribosomal protein S27AE
MAASGRLVGLLLVSAGVIIGLVLGAWILASWSSDDGLETTGAIFALAFLLGFLVLPLAGSGIYFMVKGRAEAKDIQRVEEQRRLLDIISTRGQVAVPDLVLEMKSTRDKVQADLYDLVGRGLFSGYVDWSKGMLYSVEASKLQGQQKCPNCGGELQLAGKGLIKCPYCGAEIFLTG